VPEEDVMDTWATSSCTPFLLKELVNDSAVQEKLFPVTLRPNAFEIIRTWDFYSIVKGYYNFGQAPFRDVMVSGHGLDEQGRKISKRLNNYIPSEKLLEQYGADPVRYWATGATLGQNLRFNIQEIEKGRKTTVKLWNAARFLTMYIDDFTVENKDFQYEPSDLWILAELNNVIISVAEAFEEYAYARGRDIIDSFFWSRFADYYLEFVKYRLNGEDKESKAAAQQTLKIAFLAILKIYAPILPFITEEIYQQLYLSAASGESIHLTAWPEQTKIDTGVDISDFSQAIAAIDEIRKYKSEQNISMGAELDDYTLTTPVNLDKYGSFIRGAIKVKQLAVR
jgi:valyl-tRNA synthetase